MYQWQENETDRGYDARSVQMNAKQNETFTPKHISLPKDKYESMMLAFNLPLKAVETTSVVGPFFWSALAGDRESPYLRE